ncbi:hypothetical protein [Novosphingobium sp.]|uniref:hypothetical protein n=1 Tax=Novosphingobium sp. TaxID=1874826 RepID=UPI00286D0A6F|nr:hypothetical protein [Novosphingobium sp.]
MAALVSLDQHHRGMMSDVLVASAERLQVVSAYLAAKPPAVAEFAFVGEFLSHSDHQTILRAAFNDDVPAGLRRALRRIGSSAQVQRCYTLLHQLLAQPPHASLTDCIHRLPSITRSKLLIARLLPETICRANVVEAITDVSTASDVTNAFEQLTGRGVDAESLSDAIRKVRSERDLMNIWSRWLASATCPPHPIPASNSYSPILSGDELSRLANQMRNCAKRYLLPLMAGEDAMAIMEHSGKTAMVHLRFSEDRWRCEGAYGPRNVPPPSSLREALYEHLEAHGVVVKSSTRRKPTEWDSLRRLVRSNPFDFDFD